MEQPSSFLLISEAHAQFRENMLHVFLIHLQAAHPEAGF